MIRILCAATVLIAIFAFDQRPVQAYEAPWCAVVSLGPGSDYWDCQYRSLEQCVPNVLAGNRGFCNPNPRFQGVEYRHRYHVRRHRARR